MDFSSDTSAPAHPNVIEALKAVNQGNAASYGADSVTQRLHGQLADLFETKDFDFWLCASGTAANALALSLLCPPIGGVLCHKYAHIAEDERGAPEFFTGGGKLILLSGAHGRIEAAELSAALSHMDPGFVHATPPSVLSLTNLTESGTAYSPDQIADYAQIARKAGLTVHMDGARLGNVLISTGASPARMSWQAGIDILTLGLTKCGAIGAEIIMLFGRRRAQFAELKARAKRAGHMPPKMRYLAAQAEALLQDNLWLDLSSHANQRAKKFTEIILGISGARLAHPVEGNEVFVNLSEDLVQKLNQSGAKFYPWPDGSYRFVCHWTTPQADIDQIGDILKA